jgi:hypothetical protein
MARVVVAQRARTDMAKLIPRHAACPPTPRRVRVPRPGSGPRSSISSPSERRRSLVRNGRHGSAPPPSIKKRMVWTSLVSCRAEQRRAAPSSAEQRRAATRQSGRHGQSLRNATGSCVARRLGVRTDARRPIRRRFAPRRTTSLAECNWAATFRNESGSGTRKARPNRLPFAHNATDSCKPQLLGPRPTRGPRPTATMLPLRSPCAFERAGLPRRNAPLDVSPLESADDVETARP